MEANTLKETVIKESVERKKKRSRCEKIETGLVFEFLGSSLYQRKKRDLDAFARSKGEKRRKKKRGREEEKSKKKTKQLVNIPPPANQ